MPTSTSHRPTSTASSSNSAAATGPASAPETTGRDSERPRRWPLEEEGEAEQRRRRPGPRSARWRSRTSRPCHRRPGSPRPPAAPGGGRTPAPAWSRPWAGACGPYASCHWIPSGAMLARWSGKSAERVAGSAIRPIQSLVRPRCSAPEALTRTPLAGPTLGSSDTWVVVPTEARGECRFGACGPSTGERSCGRLAASSSGSLKTE